MLFLILCLFHTAIGQGNSHNLLNELKILLQENPVFPGASVTPYNYTKKYKLTWD